MDAIAPLQLAVFLAHVFVAAFVTALVGFAFGMASLRVAIGVILVAFSVYSLVGPRLPQFRQAGPLPDGLVGAVNGVLGARSFSTCCSSPAWRSSRPAHDPGCEALL